MLRVETNVPYGNACDISITREGGTDVAAFAADPHGGPECLWFCFRLVEDDPAAGVPGRVKLILKHFRNILGGGKPENIRPVIKPAGGEWQRMERGVREDLPDGRCQAAWHVDAPRSFADIALCYPYGRPELDALVSDTAGYWGADTIGVSQGRRPIIRLSNAPGAEGSSRPGLYLIARQHSGETPGSWVLDGFLRRVATLGHAAPLVWAVPLSNIDGVEQGDYGKDNFPYDLNRAWGVQPMRHETLVIACDIREWTRRCRAVLGIDFHAPGACETEGIYTFHPRLDAFRRKEADRWAAAVQKALTREFAMERFASEATYPSRWETPNFGLHCYTAAGVEGLSLETPYSMIGDTILTRERYQEAGRRIAEGVAGEAGTL